MPDTLIKVDGVSKKFCRSLKRSLWYGIQDLRRELLGRRHGSDGELRPEEFWAIKDLSFELKRGECLGLIGHNGAGKTTLLRMLTGLIKPDQGRIEMRGRVGALIALGAGFNPILTGRENIYINGSVLGLSRQEIADRFDEIVAFAELREFIEAPVATYSSGMMMRLGFAVASTLNPDVLILDEVFAVGDARFRAKCFNRMHEVLAHASVIFVSHNLPQVTRVSTHMLLLDKGQVKATGSDISRVVSQYNAMNTIDHTGIRVGTTIKSVHVEDDSGRETQLLQHGEGFRIAIDLDRLSEFTQQQRAQLKLLIVITDNEENNAIQVLTDINGLASDGGMVVQRFRRNALNAGAYCINASIISGARGEKLSVLRGTCPFTVEHIITAYAPVIMQPDEIAVRPRQVAVAPDPSIQN